MMRNIPGEEIGRIFYQNSEQVSALRERPRLRSTLCTLAHQRPSSLTESLHSLSALDLSSRRNSNEGTTLSSLLPPEHSSASLMKFYSSVTKFSKRPICCPCADCGKLVAVMSLVLHFNFEHSKIHREFLDFGEPKCLSLDISNMTGGMSHCIALLMTFASDDTEEKQKPSGIAFPLLAAKLREIRPQQEPSSREDDKNNHEILHLPYDSNSFDHDMLLLWVCGNMDPIVHCNIEVADDLKTRSYSYRGPVNSLRDDNDPKSIYSRSDLLLLNSKQVLKITNNLTKPIDLFITVYDINGE